MSANLTLRMLEPIDGSLNGRDVRTYQAGECYELPDDGPQGLAAVFLREGWAERVIEPTQDAGWGSPLELPSFGLVLQVAPEVAAELAAESTGEDEADTPLVAGPPASSRCLALTTTRGGQCQRNAVAGSEFCGTHQQA